ncbi:tyrosine-type recombinase/integrase [Lacipirellula sp.]|uniref:tyrosine-type recombinase/integrase n=1 Tax=Lacipirellula sp. TaxID=2691419 RepID=UPI003D0D23BD
MGRRRKGPWRRGGKGPWYTTIGRENVRVADPDASYDSAFQKYVEILSERGDVPAEQLTVKNLFRRFLEWTEANRSEGTHAFYKRYLESFQVHVGGKRVTSLHPRDVERWIELKFSHCSSTTKSDLMKAVARAIHWGMQKRYIKGNPLLGMDKPARKPRELVLTPEQFKQVMSHVTDQEFRDYLNFLWLTGCRAMEIRIIERRHVDGGTITLPASEAKGKKHVRVIYLNDAGKKIINRLIKVNPNGPLFRNLGGIPWNANSVRCRFRLLKDKCEIPALCATTLRHSWATNALKSGMDSTTASILMGHQDPATLIRNYQHLTKDQQYLKDAVKSLPIILPGVGDTPLTGQA